MLDGMRSDTSPLARTNQSSAARHSRRRAIAVLAVAAITSVAACGDSEPAADAGSITTAGELDATSTTPAAAAEATSTTATATAVTLPVGEVAVHRDLAYGTVEPGNLFDLYVPDVAGESLLPLIIWHSGSGWFENDAKDRVDDRAEVVEELTQRGFAVASINVRSSADARFPAQGFDARSAIRYLRKNAATHGIDPDRFAFMGDSSGGWATAFAAMTSDILELEGETGVDGISSAVQVAVAFFPPTDFLSMDEFAAANELPRSDFYPFDLPTSAVGMLIHCPDEGPSEGPPDPTELLSIQACPEETERADPATYIDGAEVPIWLLHGLDDDVVPFNQSRLVYDATKAEGNEARLTLVPGADHAWSTIIAAEEATTWTTSRDGDEKEAVGPGPSWDEIEEFVRVEG